MPEKLRREQRYRMRDAQRLAVRIRSGNSATAKVSAVELCDLSWGGAKLIVAEPVPAVNTRIALSLTSEALGLDVTAAAEVRWTKPAEGQRWFVGLQIDPPLTTELLQRLLSEGVLDRRTSERRMHNLRVIVQWDYDTTQMPAFIWNLSEGGFCLVSPRKPGRRVLVTTENSSISVVGKVRWEMKTGGGYVVGCQFSCKESYELMTALEPPLEPDHQPGVERRRWFMRAFRHLVKRVRATRTS